MSITDNATLKGCQILTIYRMTCVSQSVARETEQKLNSEGDLGFLLLHEFMIIYRLLNL